MDADDPRHGTNAGFQQHYRDAEPACDPCREANLKACRRRRKRRTMGQRARVPLGNLHPILDELRNTGATYDDLANWMGVSNSHAWRIHNGGPTALVTVATHARISAMQVEQPVTPVGIERRIHSLHALGYSAPRIAREAGLSTTWVRVIRDRGLLAPTTEATRRSIAETYARLSSTHARAETTSERKSVTRALNLAAANGWSPPASWDAIDDPREMPTGAWRGTTRQLDGPSRDSVDHARIERILAGDFTLAPEATRSERSAVLARWPGTPADLERLTGWRVDRYRPHRGAA